MSTGGVLASTLFSRRRHSSSSISSGSTYGCCLNSYWRDKREREIRQFELNYPLSFIDALKEVYKRENQEIQKFIVTPESCKFGYMYVTDDKFPYNLLCVETTPDKYDISHAKMVPITVAIVKSDRCRVFDNYSQVLKFIKNNSDKF